MVHLIVGVLETLGDFTVMLCPCLKIKLERLVGVKVA